MCHEGEITEGTYSTQRAKKALASLKALVSPVKYSDCTFTYKVHAAALRALVALRDHFWQLEAVSGT